jgi:opacity protein-like surface antigen
MRTLLALALILTALPSFASVNEGYRVGRWEVSLNPGVAIPLGATSDEMSNSGVVQLVAGYQFNEYLNFGAELGWQFNHRWGGQTAGQFAQDFDKDGIDDRAPFSSNIHEKILGLSPAVKLGQWVDVLSYKFRPYLTMSAGFYHAWTNSGTTVVQGNDQISGKLVGPIITTYDTSSNSYFGFSGGGGLDILVDENAAVGFDLRYSRITKPYEDLEFLTPSLRISYLF